METTKAASPSIGAGGPAAAQDEALGTVVLDVQAFDEDDEEEWDEDDDWDDEEDEDDELDDEDLEEEEWEEWEGDDDASGRRLPRRVLD